MSAPNPRKDSGRVQVDGRIDEYIIKLFRKSCQTHLKNVKERTMRLITRKDRQKYKISESLRRRKKRLRAAARPTGPARRAA